MPHGRPAKRRRVTPPLDDSAVSETIKASDLFNRAADWDLEEAYEKRSRNKKTSESSRLPIKTADGVIKEVEEEENYIESDSFLGSGSDEEIENEDEDETPATEEDDTTPKIPLKEQIILAKEELARTAGLLNEDPEEHAGSFKKLAEIGGPDSHPSIQKLCLAAQAAVYKDVIPGYRIRAYKDEELGSKVSKEVRKTRQYEQALVTGYHNYIKKLTNLTKRKASASEEGDLRSVAVNCVCTLLLSVPHFNFRTELLDILARELSHREVTPDFAKCLQTLEKFFAEDEDGAPSLEAVKILTKMMKVKDYRIRQEVLNSFFHLRLLSELSIKRLEKSDQDDTMSKFRGRKVKKEKWEHRSKKERKLARERKAVEKDMRDADASVDFEEREKMQSETLKLVFVVYFRILKARTPWLIGAVLEGLAMYAHLINQDLFGDILEALKDIINQAEALSKGQSDDEDDENLGEENESEQRNMTREGLLSTQTAFTLLSSQEVTKSASALHLDLSFFTSHTFRSLYPLALDADIELGPGSLHLPDPSLANFPKLDNRINISTPVLLLTRVITSILLTPSQPPPTITAASFYKRLLTVALQLPEKSVIAVLGLLTKIVQKHGRKIEPLWYSDERKGDGIYRGDSTSIEGTNVFAVGSGVWEGELLRHHYCPKIREQVKIVDGMIAELAK